MLTTLTFNGTNWVGTWVENGATWTWTFGGCANPADPSGPYQVNGTSTLGGVLNIHLPFTSALPSIQQQPDPNYLYRLY
jgi:hypothetical protein